MPRPRRSFSPRFKAQTVPYASWPYHGERGIPPTFNSQFDLIVHFDRRDSTEGNEDVLASVPDPHGISGCGIWRLAAADKPIEAWTPEDIRHPLVMLASSLPALVPYFQLNGMW
jgi:hypothetical protein